MKKNYYLIPLLVLGVLSLSGCGNSSQSIGDSPVAGYTVPDGYNKLLMICPNATRESKSVKYPFGISAIVLETISLHVFPSFP